MNLLLRTLIYTLIALNLYMMTGCESRSRSDAEATDPKAFGRADVLVFSKTAGYRHESIPAGIEAIKRLGVQNGFSVYATEDASIFNDKTLKHFKALVFLNTTLNVLDDNQQLAMERFIQAGGGFVGIHSAADTEWEGDWYWYRNLVGAVFKNHPSSPSNVQEASVEVVDTNHPATENLPATFTIADEWYNYRDFYSFTRPLLSLDESTYTGGEHGDHHPIAWYHEYDGGRSFYTGLGHAPENFSDERFLAHLLGGIQYVMGKGEPLDYSDVRPESDRFVKKPLVEGLNEPMSFDFLPNGDAIIAERRGALKLVRQGSAEVVELGSLEVAYLNYEEMGLQGVAVDPDFENSKLVYMTYTSADEKQNLFWRVSRFKWKDNGIDFDSEEMMLQFGLDRNCCHMGGDIQFGENGELFFSAGDNTSPRDQDGYAPIDFRPDRTKDDALRSSGNTMDLRGKVLRIRPLPYGEKNPDYRNAPYEIPEDNLFPNGEGGRAEIYVMGARNPFTITYDRDTSTLFYGDVGPDAQEFHPRRGPGGFDEINRVTAAGNFGWPLVIGNNQPYVDYNFATGKSGEAFNPAAPENKSPRNTGARILPPAQPAWIWYPYGMSSEFPEMGSGGRTALVADVFRSKNYPAGKHRYPKYYDGKLFIVEFMRRWVKVVSFDEQGRILKIEPFAPRIEYSLPIDARFGPDGTLYVLEYGQAWFTGNPDARLSRVEYVGSGNRPPNAVITLDAFQGVAPLTVTASAAQSEDREGDAVTFAWHASNGEQAAGEIAKFTFTEPGRHTITLVATDALGEKADTRAAVEVGNAPPQVDIGLEGNNSFFWPDETTRKYSVNVTDKEDGTITDGARIKFDFASSKDPDENLGHQTASAEEIGPELVEQNGCGACHRIEGQSAGPAFLDVAQKYRNDENAVNYLTNKIASGGNGVWGEINMPSFAHLSVEQRQALATYVLSLADPAGPRGLPMSGEVTLDRHEFTAGQLDSDNLPPWIPVEENYIFSASYQDKGGEVIGPIATERAVTLTRPRLFLAFAVDEKSLPEGVIVDRHQRMVLSANARGERWHVVDVGEWDLTDIKSFRLGYWVAGDAAPWEFELRVGSAEGSVVGRGELNGPVSDSYTRSSATLQNTNGRQRLFLAVRCTDSDQSTLRMFDLSFHR